MKPIRNLRNNRAMTLVEMMVAVAVTGIAVAGLTELSFLSASWIDKFSAKTDINIAAKQAIDLFGKDVRAAINVGDAYGDPYNASNRSIIGTPIFPTKENPLYPAPLIPPADSQYYIDENTLILQTPIFGIEGWPTSIPKTIDEKQRRNVDTIIYQVALDADPFFAAQNHYVLKRSVFPGNHNEAQIEDVLKGNLISPGQTVLKGIVGPLDKVTGKPKIFQLLVKDPSSQAATLTSLRQPDLPLIDGIVINLELVSTQRQAAVVTYRSETRLHNQFFIE